MLFEQSINMAANAGVLNQLKHGTDAFTEKTQLPILHCDIAAKHKDVAMSLVAC